MTDKQIKNAIKKCVEKGNWIIRADNNGKAYNGFAWKPLGKWTEAPDWNTNPECGGGLHGQDKNFGGFLTDAKRLVFCDTRGGHIPIGNDKVKVRYARILMINEFPANLKCEHLEIYYCLKLKRENRKIMKKEKTDDE